MVRPPGHGTIALGALRARGGYAQVSSGDHQPGVVHFPAQSLPPHELHPYESSVLCRAHKAVGLVLLPGIHQRILQHAGGAEIRQALRHVMDDHAVIDPAVQHHLLDAITTALPAQKTPTPAPLPDGLTAREAEVLSLMASGLSNAEIAERLVVSEGTVKSHINHLLAKTSSRDRARRSCTHTSTGLPDEQVERPRSAGDSPSRELSPKLITRRQVRFVHRRQLGRRRQLPGPSPDITAWCHRAYAAFLFPGWAEDKLDTIASEKMGVLFQELESGGPEDRLAAEALWQFLKKAVWTPPAPPRDPRLPRRQPWT